MARDDEEDEKRREMEEKEEGVNKLFSEAMDLSEFVKVHGSSLPHVICIVEGHYGNNALEDMSANQILFARSLESEKRLMMKKKDGRFMSFPLTFQTPFSLLDAKDKRLKQMNVKGLMSQSLMVERQRVVLEADASTLFQVGGTEMTAEKMGVMEVFKTYKEYYLVANRIGNSETSDNIESKPLAIPAYLKLKLRILYGQDGVSPSDWTMQMTSFEQELSAVKDNKPEELKNIFIYDEGDLSINPALETVFKSRKTLKKNSESDNTNAVITGFSKKDVVEERQSRSVEYKKDQINKNNIKEKFQTDNKIKNKSHLASSPGIVVSEAADHRSGRIGTQKSQKVPHIVIEEAKPSPESSDKLNINSKNSVNERSNEISDDSDVDAGGEKLLETNRKMELRYIRKDKGKKNIIYQQFEGFTKSFSKTDENNNIVYSANKSRSFKDREGTETQHASSKNFKPDVDRQNTLQKNSQNLQTHYQTKPLSLQQPHQLPVSSIERPRVAASGELLFNGRKLNSVNNNERRNGEYSTHNVTALPRLTDYDDRDIRYDDKTYNNSVYSNQTYKNATYSNATYNDVERNYKVKHRFDYSPSPREPQREHHYDNADNVFAGIHAEGVSRHKFSDGRAGMLDVRRRPHSHYERVEVRKNNRILSYDSDVPVEKPHRSVQSRVFESETDFPRHFIYTRHHPPKSPQRYSHYDNFPYKSKYSTARFPVISQQEGKPLDSPKPKNISYSVTDTIISFDANKKLNNKKHLHDITFRANNIDIDSDPEVSAIDKGFVKPSSTSNWQAINHYSTLPFPVAKDKFYKNKEEEIYGQRSDHQTQQTHNLHPHHFHSPFQSPRHTSSTHLMQPLHLDIPLEQHRREIIISSHQNPYRKSPKTAPLSEGRHESHHSNTLPLRKRLDKWDSKAPKQDKMYLMDLHGNITSTNSPARYISREETNVKEDIRRRNSSYQGNQRHHYKPLQMPPQPQQQHYDSNNTNKNLNNHNNIGIYHNHGTYNGRNSARDFYSNQARENIVTEADNYPFTIPSKQRPSFIQHSSTTRRPDNITTPKEYTGRNNNNNNQQQSINRHHPVALRSSSVLPHNNSRYSAIEYNNTQRNNENDRHASNYTNSCEDVYGNSRAHKATLFVSSLALKEHY